MAWAVKNDTRAATHIGMLSRKQFGLACECVCPACDGVLQAVNAGQPLEHYDKPNAMRPFFRHDVGQQKDACLTKVAQLAALHLLVTQQEIDLPTRRLSRAVVGATGHVYTGTASVIGARMRVRRMDWLDEHAARITLDDGRIVLIQLAGQVVLSNAQGNEAVITIAVDDTEVSSWSPEQILQRAQLDGDWLCWQRYWDDDALAQQSIEAAEEEARKFLDWAPDGLVLPAGLTPQQHSESLLHWYLKDLLATTLRIRTPAVARTVSMVMPDGREELRHVMLPPMTLALSNIRVEESLGDIVPDLMARARDEAGRLTEFDLLIEVAVTHKVDAEKAARIAARDVACLEIDVSLLGIAGRIHVERLRDLVSGDPKNKRWIHHPELTRLIRHAHDGLEAVASREMEEMLRLEALERAFDALPDAEALGEYLERLRGLWRTGRADAQGLSVARLTTKLGSRGFRHLDGPEISAPSGVLRTLDGIRADARRGGRSSHAVAALNRLEAQEEQQMRFASLYLLAIREYAPGLANADTVRLATIRADVLRSLAAEEPKYARPTTWDKEFSALFPELAAGIQSGYGTAEQVEATRRKRLAGERKVAEAGEKELREARERNERALQEQALIAETASLIELTARKFEWAVNDGGVPMDAGSSAKLALRSSAYPGGADWVRANVESAWTARDEGVALAAWLKSRKPRHAGEVATLRDLLERAWLILKV
jgi:hypothetical protein